ncbi:hypothetical protein V6125_23115, partial [Klebsiella pneumoniae]
LHAETALGTGRMTSTFECSKKWGDYLCFGIKAIRQESKEPRFGGVLRFYLLNVSSEQTGALMSPRNTATYIQGFISHRAVPIQNGHISVC